jgi:hypothetical protein
MAGVSGPRAIEARAESVLPEYAKEAIGHGRPGRNVRTYFGAHICLLLTYDGTTRQAVQKWL